MITINDVILDGVINFGFLLFAFLIFKNNKFAWVPACVAIALQIYLGSKYSTSLSFVYLWLHLCVVVVGATVFFKNTKYLFCRTSDVSTNKKNCQATATPSSERCIHPHPHFSTNPIQKSKHRKSLHNMRQIILA